MTVIFFAASKPRRRKATTCTACPAGKKGKDTEDRVSEAKACEECKANTYQAKAGQTECKECAKNHVAPPNSKQCVVCVENSTVLGYSADGDEPKCDKFCQRHYQPNANRTRCVTCPAGKDGSRMAGTCDPCEKSKIRKGSTGEACENCAKDHEANSDRTECTPCSAGKYRDEKMGKCEKCPGGYYCPEGKGKQECGTGKDTHGFWGITDMGSTNESDCKSCEPGKFRAVHSYDGHSGFRCEKCAVGKYQDKKRTKCLHRMQSCDNYLREGL